MEQMILPCLYAFCASVAFSIVFELRGWKYILSAAGAGAAGWLTYLLLDQAGSVFRNLVATVVVAILAEIFARMFRTPATVFLIIGIVPLVPGGGIYYTLEALIDGDMASFVEKGLGTVAAAGSIAVGCSLVSSVVRIVFQRRAMKQVKNTLHIERNEEDCP